MQREKVYQLPRLSLGHREKVSCPNLAQLNRVGRRAINILVPWHSVIPELPYPLTCRISMSKIHWFQSYSFVEISRKPRNFCQVMFVHRIQQPSPTSFFIFIGSTHINDSSNIMIQIFLVNIFFFCNIKEPHMVITYLIINNHLCLFLRYLFLTC